MCTGRVYRTGRARSQPSLGDCLCETVKPEHDCPQLWRKQYRLLQGSQDSTLATVNGLLIMEDLFFIVLIDGAHLHCIHGRVCLQD